MKVCPKCGKQYPDDANFCPLDAGRLVVDNQPSAPAPAPAAKPAAKPGDGGRVVGGRFALGEHIGGGLSGEVYQAVDQQQGTACAVKLVDAAVFPSSLLMQRTERELRQLVRLDSAGIAKVYAHGREGKSLWIATELFADSRSLHDVVFDDGPMELERASRIVLAIGQALADAAKIGVIHRDLAPKNVLIGTGDQVKIINFGVAVPGTDKVPGVPEFVAPEMVEGKPVDQRANIYNLGAVFYYLLTGRPPFMGEPEEVHEQHLSGTPEPPSEHVELPDVVDGVVLKALERSSSKRFMTLRQFLSAVEHLAQGNLDMVSPVVTQPLGRAGKGKNKKRQLSSTMLGYGKTGETAAVNPPAADPDPGSTQKLGSTSQSEPGQPAQSEPAQPAQSEPAQPAAAASTTAAETQAMGSMGSPGSGPVSQTPAAQDTAPAAASAQAAAEPASTTAQAPAPRTSAEPAKVESAAAAQQPAAEPAAPVASEAAPGARATPADEQNAAGQEKATQVSRRRQKNKGKFRETLWFKKGEMDSEAAAKSDKGKPTAKDDLMPLEDRYEDDGSLSTGDHEKFSLKTGATESMPAFGKRPNNESVSSKELIDEMKGGRGKIIALVVLGVVALIILIIVAISGSGDDKANDKPGSEGKEESGAKPEAPAPAPQQ